MKPSILNDFLEGALYSLPIGITLGFLYKRVSMVAFLVSLGAGLLSLAYGCNLLIANLVMSVVLILMVNYYAREGFSTHTSQADISSRIRQLKTHKVEKSEILGSDVYQNIKKGGYNNPGFGMFGPLVEGFEDEKKEPKVSESKPAPVENKKELPSPFKLGEIPAQVKNGPHIDAGSTLMKAIQGLDPNQINAMTKDTQQLIETQKSLMGMLGSMKPMMQDGKELMDTFQQMFGNQ